MVKTGKRCTAVAFLTVLVAWLLLIPASAQDEDASILLSRLTGTVEVAHADLTAAEWIAASVGIEIGGGWRLRTGEASKAQLVFPRDNVVILKENSVLYVDQLDAGGGAGLQASAGSLLVDLQNALAPGSDFELETPTALAVVRGTKYGAADIDEYDVTFYGYRGLVDIFDSAGQFPPVQLGAGLAVDVAAGEAPGEPYLPGPEAQQFVADAEDSEGFEAAEEQTALLAAGLEAILARLQEHDVTLADYEDEWARYERRDQTSHMLYLYAQVLSLCDQVDVAADDYAAAIADQEELAGAPGAQIEALLADLYARLDDLASEAEPLIGDEEELLEMLRGTIPPGAPALGLRWNLIDTDNDGLSDMDELALGTDPMVSNDDGFFDLIAPDDGEEFDYPETDLVSFEFEPLDSEIVLSYDLMLEADGVQWQRRDVDAAEDVDLSVLVGPGGVFADLLATTDSVEIQWLVMANLDADRLVARVAAQTPAMPPSGPASVPSQQWTLTINVPPPDQFVVIDLVPAGPVSVAPGDRVRVRAVIDEVADLGEWELTIVYDPSVLEFDTGRRLGLFAGSTLFFGDQLGGVLTVSGSVPRGAAGVTGSGELFELEFLALEEGSSTVEITDVALTDILGREIVAEGGETVDIDVLANAFGSTAGAYFKD